MRVNTGIAICILFLFFCPATLCAQSTPIEPLMPSRVTVVDSNLLPAIPDVPQPVTIRLLDSAGIPVKADKDIELHIEAERGLSLGDDSLLIRKGQSSAQLMITKRTPGISGIRITQAQVPTTVFGGHFDLDFAPESNYQPAPPLNVLLTVSPGNWLVLGSKIGKIIAFLRDNNGNPVDAGQDVTISFPKVVGDVSPCCPLDVKIAKGQRVGETEVTSTTDVPHDDDLVADVSPPYAYGKPISTTTGLQIHFTSAPITARIIATPDNPETVFKPTIQVRVELIGQNKNLTATDQPRTFRLNAYPTGEGGGGRLEDQEITIREGSSSAQTTFVPYQEGITEINAEAGGPLKIEPGRVNFRYRWLAFLLIAGLGGAMGGIARQYARGRHSFMKYFWSAVAGIFVGSLAFVLAPMLVSIGLKPEYLQSVTKLFEGFAWGFFGGFNGPRLFKLI